MPCSCIQEVSTSTHGDGVDTKEDSAERSKVVGLLNKMLGRK